MVKAVTQTLRAFVERRGHVDQAGGEDRVARAEAQRFFLIGLDDDAAVVGVDDDFEDLRHRHFGALSFVGDEAAVGDEEHAGVERRLVDAVLLKRERDRAFGARQSAGDARAGCGTVRWRSLSAGDVVFGEPEPFAKRFDLGFLRGAEAVVGEKMPDDGGVETRA